MPAAHIKLFQKRQEFPLIKLQRHLGVNLIRLILEIILASSADNWNALSHGAFNLDSGECRAFLFAGYSIQLLPQGSRANAGGGTDFSFPLGFFLSRPFSTFREADTLEKAVSDRISKGGFVDGIRNLACAVFFYQFVKGILNAIVRRDNADFAAPDQKCVHSVKDFTKIAMERGFINHDNTLKTPNNFWPS